MQAKITESAIETFAIQLLEHQGYTYVYGPAIAPDSDSPERQSFEEEVLLERVPRAYPAMQIQGEGGAPPGRCPMLRCPFVAWGCLGLALKSPCATMGA